MCVLYAKTMPFFYQGLEYPWILLPSGALEWIPHLYKGQVLAVRFFSPVSKSWLSYQFSNFELILIIQKFFKFDEIIHR
jgi:hypothetical protein